MSYILEALKKSQRERELGQVPTLADAPYLTADRPGRGVYWGIVAVSLAVLATLIALYAAFGDRRLSVGDTQPPTVETTRDATPGPVAAEPPRSTEGRTESSPATPAAATELQQSGRRPEKPVKTSPAVSAKSAKPVTPPAPPPATDPVVVASPAPARRLTPGTPDVPPDLLRDVRRFEKRLLQQESMEPPDTEASEPSDDFPAEPSVADAPEPEPFPAEEPENDVRTQPAPQPGLPGLPPPPQQSIPDYRLTVHVYSADPERRFVIINSRKMREGERSRKDLLVEEITPDGAVLEYKGRRFFHRR